MNIATLRESDVPSPYRKWRRYPEYRSTDISWLSKMPRHWKSLRLKHLGKAVIGLTYSPSDICSEDGGTLVLRASNIQDGRIVRGDNVFVNTRIPQGLRTCENDILICSRNGSRHLVGKCALIGAEDVGLSFGAFTTAFRSKANRYLFWLFNSGLMTEQAGLYQTSTIFQLTTGILNEFRVPLPSSVEQTAISVFLEHETRLIDDLIESKRRLLDLGKERELAAITDFTGGTAVGSEQVRLGFYVDLLSGFAFKSEGFSQSEDDIPLLRGTNVGVGETDWTDVVRWDRTAATDYSAYALCDGDIVLGMDRPWVSAGIRIARIRNRDLPCLLLQRVARLRAKNGLLQDYLDLLLNSKHFLNSSSR